MKPPGEPSHHEVSVGPLHERQDRSALASPAASGTLPKPVLRRPVPCAMRALLLAVGATLGACRLDAGAVIAPAPASATSTRVPALVTATTAAGPPASPPSTAHERAAPPATRASTCFAEPLIHDKNAAHEPMPADADADADARLRQCGTLAEGARAACRFALAREHFEAKRFDRAGPLFLAIAHDPRASDAPVAVRLAFESMNMLASVADPGRASCYLLMAEEVPKLLSERCTPAPGPRDEEACALLHAIDVDLASCSECTAGTVSGRGKLGEHPAGDRYHLGCGSTRVLPVGGHAQASAVCPAP